MRTRARIIALLAGSSALFGCQPGCETEGLSDLFDTSPTFVRFPGRQLAKGHYSGFSLDGTVPERGFILVRDQDKDGDLTIVPLRGGEPCRVGPAVRYWSFLMMFGLQGEDDEKNPLKGYIPFLPSLEADGTGTLKFATFGCEISDVTVPGVRSPIRTGVMLSPPAFLALRSGAELSAANPWDGTSKRVAESVTDAAFDGKHLWTIESGEIVIRDSSLSEQGRYGNGVTGYRINGVGEGLFIDSEGLQEFKLAVPTATPLVEDACGIASPRGASTYLATLSPCADARLTIYDRVKGKSYPIASGASTDTMVTSLQGSEGSALYLIYATDVDPATRLGKLWATVLGKEPELISEAASMGSVSAAVEGRLPLIVDAVSGSGRLVLWSPGGDTKEIARDVADYNLPFVLDNYDGATGTLSYRHTDGKLEKLASGAPNLGQSFDDYRAVLADYENEVGTLMLIKQDGDRLAVEPVADSVPRRGYLFLQFADALSYLKVDEPGAAFGRLEVLFLESDETFGTDGVSEWMGMDWPEVGIAYAVHEGKQAGLWFGALQ